MRRSSIFLTGIIAAAVFLAAVSCIVQDGDARGVLSGAAYRVHIYHQLHWTNRAQRARCRPTFALRQFTKVPLASVSFAWRDVRLERARRTHRRALARSSRCVPWYVTKQMRVGDLVGAGGDRGGTDPWPNCPDPWDHRGASWGDTVACENRAYHELFGYPREWLDSPGYFRCGLQFDPSWENIYGRLCP